MENVAITGSVNPGDVASKKNAMSRREGIFIILNSSNS
jgi:hypothetical protein